MEELQARHRKEQRDLISRVTQKKKAASKKTRKTVNDECERLEEELKARQQEEILAYNNASLTSPTQQEANGSVDSVQDTLEDDILASLVDPASAVGELQTKTASLDISAANGEVKANKPSRQKARLARRAAEQEAVAAQAAAEAALLPDLKSQERSKMLEQFKHRGLVEKIIPANGHCLYSAVADQMLQLRRELNHAATSASPKQAADGEQPRELDREDYRFARTAAASYISDNPDDFVPFLEEPVDAYIDKIENTAEWGGQLELMALAKTYRININVLQADGRTEKIQGSTGESGPETWIAYYRHGFGLGEHYNSLRKSAPKVPTG